MKNQTIKKFMEVTDLLNTRITDLSNSLDKLEKRLHSIEKIVYKAVGIAVAFSSVSTFILTKLLH